MCNVPLEVCRAVTTPPPPLYDVGNLAVSPPPPQAKDLLTLLTFFKEPGFHSIDFSLLFFSVHVLFTFCSPSLISAL